MLLYNPPFPSPSSFDAELIPFDGQITILIITTSIRLTVELLLAPLEPQAKRGDTMEAVMEPNEFFDPEKLLRTLQENISVPQAAKILGISKDHLYREVDAGAISHNRFGRRITISPLDLLR